MARIPPRISTTFPPLVKNDPSTTIPQLFVPNTPTCGATHLSGSPLLPLPFSAPGGSRFAPRVGGRSPPRAQAQEEHRGAEDPEVPFLGRGRTRSGGTKWRGSWSTGDPLEGLDLKMRDGCRMQGS